MRLIRKRHAKDFQMTCLGHTLDMPGTYEGHTKDLLKICIKYGQDKPKIRQRNAEHMSMLCQEYAKYMPINPTYVKYTLFT